MSPPPGNLSRPLGARLGPTLPAPSTKAALREMCQTDLYAFTKIILGFEELTETLHWPLCRVMQATPYPINLYLMARDFFKTTIITVAHSIQLLLTQPDIRILIGSNKADNAQAMLRQLKGCLSNPWLIDLFPEILWADPARQAEQWTTEAVTVKRTRRGRKEKEATVETIGIEGELTSRHYDHMKFDDLVGKENSQTRDQLMQAIRWWQDAQGLCEPHTRQDLVGTPWHYADLYGWAKDRRRRGRLAFGLYEAPAWRVDAAGTRVPLFPERWPLTRLDEFLASQGEEVFSAQRLLNPISGTTAIFTRARILPSIRPRSEVPDPATLWIAMTVDPAISTKAWADYSAIAVGGFSRSDVEYLLDLRRGRWDETELIRQIYDAWERTPGIQVVGFEAVSFAKLYRHLFTSEGERRGYYLPVIALDRDTRITKNIRIRGLQPRWNSGRLVLVDDLPVLEEFLDEAERFRTYAESTHDDMLDAVVDLEQVRARPAGTVPADEARWRDDPEAWARLQFEQRCLDRTPGISRGSLRMAWAVKQFQDRTDQEETAAVLGVEADEFWG